MRWEDYLQISEISVAFDPQSDYWSDVEQLLKPPEGRSLDEIIEDVRLYRGELLPGFYDEWVGTERDRLQAAYHQKTNYLLDRLIQARRWDEALVWGEQWIRLGYSPEPAYRALIKAHAGLGNLGMVSTTYLPFREIMELLTGDIEARWSAGAINRDYAQFLWNMIPVSVKALINLGPDLIDTFVPGVALYERATACAGSESDWLIRLDRLIQQRTADLAIRKPHQSDLFISYSKVLQALARQAPIVLIVDDLQWTDLGSISLLFSPRSISGWQPPPYHGCLPSRRNRPGQSGRAASA